MSYHLSLYQKQGANFLPFQRENYSKTKKKSNLVKDKSNEKELLNSSHKRKINNEIQKNESIEKIKRIHKKKEIQNKEFTETTYSHLPKCVRELIHEKLDIESLKQIRLAGKEGVELVRKKIIKDIHNGKTHQELGFNSIEDLNKFISKNTENIDDVIKQATINCINKGESSQNIKFPRIFPRMIDFIDYLGDEACKKVETLKLNTLPPKMVLTKEIITKLSKTFPNIKRINLINCRLIPKNEINGLVLGQSNYKPDQTIFKKILESFPKLTSLSLDQDTIDDSCTEYLKNLKIKVLEINGNSLNDLYFLEYLPNLEVLALNGFQKNIPNDLIFSKTLKEIHLKI